MASLTPRQSIERLIIGGDPVTVCGHTVSRVDNFAYMVDGKRIGGNLTLTAAINRVLFLITGEREPVDPVTAGKQTEAAILRRIERAKQMHPCMDCGTPVHRRSLRCKRCSKKVGYARVDLNGNP